MRTKRGALEWAHAHHSDFVVLQPHSHWYNTQQSTGATYKMVMDWQNGLKPLGQAAMLFEVWADGDRAEFYTNPAYHAFSKDPTANARQSAIATALLLARLGTG